MDHLETVSDDTPVRAYRLDGSPTSVLGRLGRLSVLVEGYDEAIEFYVDRLGFEVLHDGEVDESPEDVSVHVEDLYGNRFVLVELRE